MMEPRQRYNIPVRTSVYPIVFAVMLGMGMWTAVLPSGVVVASDTIWEPLKVGGGGWVTGMDVCRTGNTAIGFAKTDTYGAYIKELTDNTAVWTQVVRSNNMPGLAATYGGNPNTELATGTYAVAIAPSNCNVLYMNYINKVWKSTDRGGTWTQTAFSTTATLDPNSQTGYERMSGEKMAVDPANPDVVYAGAFGDGMYVTFNGGTTWSKVSGLPTPVSPGVTGIVFDSTSGTTSGRTNTVYASVGSGVYRTTNAGATWAVLSGGPSGVTHAAVATDGIYYAVNMSTNVYKYASGVWSSTNAGNTWHTVMADPFNAARVIVGRDAGELAVSTDRGATFNMYWGETRTAPATDVQWLGWANETYMSSGAQRFDPVVPNKVWFTQGIGVWYTTQADRPSGAQWVASSKGIEQLVGTDVVIPPGGSNVLVTCWDRSVFTLPKSNTSYPSRYGTEVSPATAIIHAWAVNYSVSNPAHVVALVTPHQWGGVYKSGYSLDSGATWTLFPSQPTGYSGSIAATSIDSIIVVTGGGYIKRSTDRGVSWTTPTLPGATAGDAQNLFANQNTKKFVLAADSVNIGTVYLYFYTKGVYRSTDHGATWTLVNAINLGVDGYWNARIRHVYGKAGHLFLTAGKADPGNPKSGEYFYRSMDGGSTWTTVPGFLEVWDVATGKAAPGQSYPAIYVAGFYSNVWGIWRSTDNATTWTNIGPHPVNSLDTLISMSASQDVYGDVYVAFNGSGWGYGKLGSPPSQPPSPQPPRLLGISP